MLTQSSTSTKTMFGAFFAENFLGITGEMKVSSIVHEEIPPAFFHAADLPVESGATPLTTAFAQWEDLDLSFFRIAAYEDFPEVLRSPDSVGSLFKSNIRVFPLALVWHSLKMNKTRTIKSMREISAETIILISALKFATNEGQRSSIESVKWHSY